MSREPAEERYDRALKLWEDTAFEYLRNPMTKKVGNEFLNFLENCDKLFPKYLYEGLEIKQNHPKLRKRPFEYSISSKIEALYPEVEYILKTLKKHGYEMHVASSSHSSHIKGLVEANSLDKYMKSY
ncbi:MAG: HAD hydrolase-like protein, partial [Candidatus Kariarchaeaceae archaeon]